MAAGVALLLGFLCLGVFGGETAHSTPGSPFHPDFSLLSMDVDSFAVWGIILIGLAVSAVYSWHPSQRSSRRQRSLGYPTAGASLLGAGALLFVFAEWFFVRILGVGGPGLGWGFGLVMPALFVLLGIFVIAWGIRRAR